LYKKHYADEKEHLTRFTIWQQNSRYIHKHPQTPYTVSMNQFGDLTSEEFGKLYTNPSIVPLSSSASLSHGMNSGDKVTPSNWDWRSKGIIGPVHNQGQMDDVAAIVVTDNLNTNLALINNKPYNTSCSVDNLNDCVADQTLNAMFAYATSHGVDTASSYPNKGVCSFNPKTLCVRIGGAVNMTSEAHAKIILYNAGPMSASFDAGQSSFQFYSGGIYTANCSPISLDHAMLLIGYGVTGGVDYWTVQNSWGESWGIQGYAYIGRGTNVCGIMSNTLSPTMPK